MKSTLDHGLRRAAAIVLSAIVLAAAPAAAQPAPLRHFGDWVVGCDNVRACHATSLLADGGTLEGLSIAIMRDAAPDAAPRVIVMDAGNGPGGLLVRAAGWALDGIRLEIGFELAQHQLRPARGADADLVAAIRHGREITLVDAVGVDVAAVPLNGLSASLLHMDEVQRRLGTQGALIGRGSRADASLPAPPALPVIRAPPASDTPPRQLGDAGIERETQAFGCPGDAPRQAVAYHRLDARTTLALVPSPCGGGAYNSQSRGVLIAEDGTTRPARPELPMDREVPSLLFNAAWDARHRVLGLYMKTRGLGDCGLAQSQVWDGEGFRLARQIELEPCRGSVDFITTWRAVVLPR